MVKLHAGCGIKLKLSNFYLTLVTVDTEVLRKPARQFTIERWQLINIRMIIQCRNILMKNWCIERPC